MPVTPPPRQELLAVEYTSSGTSTTTTGSGAALSAAWGGTFTIANRTSVDIEVDVPFLSLSIGGTGATHWSEVHVVVDGTSRGSAFVPSQNGSTPVLGGTRKGVRLRVNSLTAGAHTVAVWLKVGGGTGTVTASAANPGLLTVREV